MRTQCHSPRSLPRLTDSSIECFFKGGRVAAHVRSYVKGKHTTLPEHMPAAHRKHMKWTPARLLNWGENIGVGTRSVVHVTDRHIGATR
jgi:hypothetical protein